MAKKNNSSRRNGAKRYYDKGSMDELVRADKNAFANLPTQLVIAEYPKSTEFYVQDLNDGVSGIDHQIVMDSKIKKGGLQPEKV